MRTGSGAVLAVALLLAACGNKGSDAAKDGGSGSTGGGFAALPASGWKVLDACATLDKAKVAAATGTTVASAMLGAVNEGKGGMASLSTCTYALGNGGSVGVLLRESPDDNDPVVPANYVSQSESMGMKLEPVTGVGAGAFWADGLKSLQVFVDKRRYTAINYSTPPAGTDAKAALTQIAHALGA